MNKNLIQFLIKLKNASIARKHLIVVNHVNAINGYLNTLYKEGFIQSFNIKSDETNKKVVYIYLRHFQNRVLTENIQFLSIPSRIKILSYNDLTKISLRNKLMVLSTSKGILGHKECLKYKTGGIAMLIC
ncbi:MAG: 30S ribosomal protein S8 [Pedobacter sp.]|nr:MAG: 30S ribosomal protein S8 [Pedobacter sp.]